MRILIPAFFLISLSAIFALEAEAQRSSTHVISVDRVFSARDRSMSYRYLVSIRCHALGEDMNQRPVKNSSFGWQFGNKIGSSTTDSSGNSEFTQTSFDGNLAEVLQIVYLGKTMIFTAAHGVQNISVDQSCR
ncbi:hypothetical protein ACLSU7_01520 [Bdellovibrio sp. HCB185ZH]|uniref:hypothetical protein n=1 Tax=Bdellovibrio sp. HCB185ZH TaxID=3394235 RepID=UPI0039A6BAE0